MNSQIKGGVGQLIPGAVYPIQPGQVFYTSSSNTGMYPLYPSGTYQQTVCPCGAIHTKTFANPKGISVPASSEGELMTSSFYLYLCDACDFRFTVMRAAGRSEEFIKEYEAKQKERAAKDAELQEKFHQIEREKRRQEAKQMQAQYQNMQNAYPGLLGQASSNTNCTENVQASPVKQKPWWKIW